MTMASTADEELYAASLATLEAVTERLTADAVLSAAAAAHCTRLLASSAALAHVYAVASGVAAPPRPGGSELAVLNGLRSRLLAYVAAGTDALAALVAQDTDAASRAGARAAYRSAMRAVAVLQTMLRVCPAMALGSAYLAAGKGSATRNAPVADTFAQTLMALVAGPHSAALAMSLAEAELVGAVLCQLAAVMRDATTASTRESSRAPAGQAAGKKAPWQHLINHVVRQLVPRMAASSAPSATPQENAAAASACVVLAAFATEFPLNLRSRQEELVGHTLQALLVAYDQQYPHREAAAAASTAIAPWSTTAPAKATGALLRALLAYMHIPRPATKQGALFETVPSAVLGLMLHVAHASLSQLFRPVMEPVSALSAFPSLSPLAKLCLAPGMAARLPSPDDAHHSIAYETVVAQHLPLYRVALDVMRCVLVSPCATPSAQLLVLPHPAMTELVQRVLVHPQRLLVRSDQSPAARQRMHTLWPDVVLATAATWAQAYVPRVGVAALATHRTLLDTLARSVHHYVEDLTRATDGALVGAAVLETDLLRTLAIDTWAAALSHRARNALWSRLEARLDRFLGPWGRLFCGTQGDAPVVLMTAAHLKAQATLGMTDYADATAPQRAEHHAVLVGVLTGIMTAAPAAPELAFQRFAVHIVAQRALHLLACPLRPALAQRGLGGRLAAAYVGALARLVRRDDAVAARLLPVSLRVFAALPFGPDPALDAAVGAATRDVLAARTRPHLPATWLPTLAPLAAPRSETTAATTAGATRRAHPTALTMATDATAAPAPSPAARPAFALPPVAPRAAAPASAAAASAAAAAMADVMGTSDANAADQWSASASTLGKHSAAETTEAAPGSPKRSRVDPETGLVPFRVLGGGAATTAADRPAVSASVSTAAPAAGAVSTSRPAAPPSSAPANAEEDDDEAFPDIVLDDDDDEADEADAEDQQDDGASANADSEAADAASTDAASPSAA
ncbi:hypothetical protein CXG81DRAFT_19369 [Caulochytrium protostelioides]|uniref:Uncharacterized protein n=1 Tax=Caulochytrium protostelioides TaxID=1555241 RepID=A0A4P9X6B3_9FUNG|nr:hypothetical protein CXG81DRAFT_19369 [Caulochytrium protostelioides]|eukprot:RKP00713.1 hypothetical protein CXG81DRAFT_19369 [Caulochytrium protostelioides]